MNEKKRSIYNLCGIISLSALSIFTILTIMTVTLRIQYLFELRVLLAVISVFPSFIRFGIKISSKEKLLEVISELYNNIVILFIAITQLAFFS